ncbi:MAG TPA: hypothetical protein VFB14_08480 [Bryobacteraceae bacterium]|jgi:hypothetical protein|nr:hypothetical protein [Bryobacteraceae bacterium]
MRSLYLALAVLAAPLIPASVFAGSSSPPNFSGSWQLDAAKSPQAGGRNITLNIQDNSGKIDFTRVVRDRDGKEVKSTFTCDTVGTQCVFDEGSHKAKVSLWYDGPALVILKTDGPKEDAVTQWRLEMAPDGNSLKVQFDHIDPTDKSETFVFDKKSPT